MELSGTISNIAMSKKREMLEILQGVRIEDAIDSLNSALSTINLFLSEQNRNTLFDKKVIEKFFSTPVL